MLETAPKRLSSIAESLLWLDGKQFSLYDYPMYKAIYDGRYRSTLLMCGRQVAKSTSLANFIIAESVAIPHFREYYLSPSREQTLIFSNTRVGKVLSYSPLVRKYFQSPETSDRVLHRSYTNGSENGFTYACDDADRARGFSADRVCYDEFQDMLFDAVVPVVNECMANSKYKFETYTGTPKTMESSIQHLWERSSQSEWVMKCNKCGKHSFVAGDKCFGKRGLICLACGGLLNPREGFWVDMKAADKDSAARQIKGFHIPQAILPANIPVSNPGGEEAAQERWNDLLHKLATYPAHRFRNEVLGISDAMGTRLVSLDEMKALCRDYALRPYIDPPSYEGVAWTVGGVDWSGGGTGGVSRTVMWVYGYVPGTQKLRCLYYEIMNGSAVQDVQRIAQIFGYYQVRMVVGDAGEGALPNAMLRDILGHHRCTMVQYGAFNKPVTWNGTDRFHVDRTALIDNYLMQLKQQRIEYANYREMEASIKDVLNVYEEVTTSGRKVWRHSPQQPDDCLHAQLFAWLAAKITTGDLKFYDFGG